MSKTAYSTAEPELIPIGKLNLNKLSFSIPDEADIKDKDGKASGKYMKCNISYLNSKKEPVNGLYMQAPKQFTFGVSPKFTYLKEKTPENLKGYQVCYFLTDPNSKETAKPTSDEQAFIKDLQAVVKKLSDHLKENADYLSPAGADLARDGKLVKQIANYPQKEIVDEKTGRKRKIVDKTKPLRFYAEVMMIKKTNKIITNFYGPGDVPLDPMTLIDVRGYIEPVIKVDWIYIGDKVTTFQIKIFEANFTPTETASRPRLIGKNTDAPVASKASSGEGGDDEPDKSDDDQNKSDTDDAPKSKKSSKSPTKKSPNADLDDPVEGEDEQPKKKVVGKPKPSSGSSKSSSSSSAKSSTKTSTSSSKSSSKKPAKPPVDDDLDFDPEDE